MAHVERLLVNLRILSRVEPFEKLNTKSGDTLVIEGGGWGSGSSVARWARGDNRANAIKRLNELFDAVQTALLKPLVTRDEERLRSHVASSRHGLCSLRRTYESDSTMTARYDVLLDKVSDLVGESASTSTSESAD